MPARFQMLSPKSWISSPMIALVASASFLLAPLQPVTSDPSGPPAMQSATAAGSGDADAILRSNLQAVVSTFIWAISNRQAPAVWHFSPEDYQAEFETEAAALKFFARIHPPLAYARNMRFDGIGFDDGGAHASVYITDTNGLQWLARFALAPDPAGDWKIISCNVRLAPGDLA